MRTCQRPLPARATGPPRGCSSAGQREPARSCASTSEAGAHDLAGQELHHYADSRPNNVDIRYGFPLGGKREALVVTSSPSSIVAAPGFVDAGARDLRLLPGSPPVDQGVTTGIGQHLDGLPLPVDGDGDGTAATDVGAYERRS